MPGGVPEIVVHVDHHGDALAPDELDRVGDRASKHTG